ncbi:MAG: cell division protein FtsL [Deltaproteobacteria bacterium]|nr:cell division protein FtsL [Deltaproteobacteria bacterium]
MAVTIAKRFGISGALGSQEIRTRRDLKDMNYLYTALGVAVVLLAVVFVYVWARITVTRIGYEISSANAARSALIEKNGRLRVAFVKLKAPDRIEKIASDELKLVHPKGSQIITISR